MTSAATVEDGDVSRSPKRPRISSHVCPRHGCILRGTCIRCHHRVENLTSCTRFDYLAKDLWIADWNADMMRRSNTAKLLEQKRLVLILDLDHTLLHSKKMDDVAKKDAHLLGMTANLSSQYGLFRVEPLGRVTKLRPFARKLLREAGTMFDLFVYTMGTWRYAVEMAKILDPDGDMFCGGCRVISREDCSTKNRKGLDVVLGGEERVVVILDDTREVWERHTENLIQIERYRFFGSHNSLLEFVKIDESEEYGALARTLGVLKKLHHEFFETSSGVSEASSRDTREVLKRIREAPAIGSGDNPGKSLKILIKDGTFDQGRIIAQIKLLFRSWSILKKDQMLFVDFKNWLINLIGSLSLLRSGNSSASTG